MAGRLLLTAAAGRRRLACPPGQATRPTPARVREALFDRMGRPLPTDRVLDVCAGSGTLGLEALGRGAQAATFIEPAHAAFRALVANLAPFAGRARALRGDAQRVLPQLGRRGARFALIFVDPPYALGLWACLLEMVVSLKLLAEGGIVVVEYPARAACPAAPPGLVTRWQRAFGAVGVALMGEKDLPPCA